MDSKRPSRSGSTLSSDLKSVATLRVPVAKNPAAVALGRLGGMRGGPARADALSSERRSEIAKKAALARWSRLPDGEEKNGE